MKLSRGLESKKATSDLEKIKFMMGINFKH